MNNQLELVGAATLASYLNVSTRTLSTYVKEKIIPQPYKVKGRVMWDLAEVRQALEKAKVK